MKKIIFIFLLLLPLSLFAENPSCQPGKLATSNYYKALIWSQNSAERNAVFREVFSGAELQVLGRAKDRNLKPGGWGVVFGLDNTLLDTSSYYRTMALQCKDPDQLTFLNNLTEKNYPSTPGAAKITCNIQKMGGLVSIVTRRDPTQAPGVVDATVNNLVRQNICFDQIIFMNGGKTNKNPYFRSIILGEYPDSLMVTQKLPAHLVVAYFGDNIQDFPNLTQSQMLQNNQADSPAYDNFGMFYFMLPNPIYGSWEYNNIDG